MELDAEKRRIIVNLRCSDLKFSLAGQDWKNVLSKRLKEYLRERMDALRLKDSLNQHPIGAVREAKVRLTFVVCLRTCVCIMVKKVCDVV